MKRNDKVTKDIDNVLENILERNPVRLRENTPSILISNGVRNLPMYENPSHIRKNILTVDEARSLGLIINHKDHYHGLGKDKFLAAIENLDNPRTVFLNLFSGNYIFITAVKDYYGNNLIVPIEPNTTTNIKNKKININRIKTIYGYNIMKPDLNEYIKYNIKNNVFKKIEIKKEQGMGNSTIASSYVNNIPQTSNVVKDGISNKYSMQISKDNTKELDNSSFILSLNCYYFIL